MTTDFRDLKKEDFRLYNSIKKIRQRYRDGLYTEEERKRIEQLGLSEERSIIANNILDEYEKWKIKNSNGFIPPDKLGGRIHGLRHSYLEGYLPLLTRNRIENLGLVPEVTSIDTIDRNLLVSKDNSYEILELKRELKSGRDKFSRLIKLNNISSYVKKKYEDKYIVNCFLKDIDVFYLKSDIENVKEKIKIPDNCVSATEVNAMIGLEHDASYLKLRGLVPVRYVNGKYYYNISDVEAFIKNRNSKKEKYAIGSKHGNLTIINEKENDAYKCKCECGNITFISMHNIHKTKSCGCYGGQFKKGQKAHNEKYTENIDTVVKMARSGLTQNQIAVKLNTHPTVISRWMSKYETPR